MEGESPPPAPAVCSGCLAPPPSSSSHLRWRRRTKSSPPSSSTPTLLSCPVFSVTSIACLVLCCVSLPQAASGVAVDFDNDLDRLMDLDYRSTPTKNQDYNGEGPVGLASRSGRVAEGERESGKRERAKAPPHPISDSPQCPLLLELAMTSPTRPILLEGRRQSHPQRDRVLAFPAAAPENDWMQAASGPGVRKFMGIIDSVALAGRLFTKRIPKDAFSGNVARLEMGMKDGYFLPNWLTFDPLTQVISGIPSSIDVGTFEFTVKAFASKNSRGESPPPAVENFMIEVLPRYLISDYMDRTLARPSLKCNSGEHLVLMSLVVDSNLLTMKAEDRVQLVKRIAGYFTLNTSHPGFPPPWLRDIPIRWDWSFGVGDPARPTTFRLEWGFPEQSPSASRLDRLHITTCRPHHPRLARLWPVVIVVFMAR
ncbi:unnamed protein product [Cyprideis torosa]|uniref:Uncharacterized protein n=1 Tax=Cyprideis torosa TaxID=163714 RepID=A0A7R8ZHY2_9CRUS|nr:unnamed protein product [Cyprideis torosa]CAG0884836.1 unnamed protein product [Cyprideis torosa]